MFRSENNLVSFEFELFKVRKFRTGFRNLCLHFFFMYLIFLIQYTLPVIGYNISLEPFLTTRVSFQHICRQTFSKKTILGDESWSKSVHFDQNKSTGAISHIFFDIIGNYSCGEAVTASTYGPLDPRFESRRKLFQIVVGLKNVAFVVKNRPDGK